MCSQTRRHTDGSRARTTGGERGEGRGWGAGRGLRVGRLTLNNRGRPPSLVRREAGVHN